MICQAKTKVGKDCKNKAKFGDYCGIHIPKEVKFTITITYGDVAENHVGMEKIGNPISSGFTLEELKLARDYFPNSQLIHLNELIDQPAEDAYLLLCPGGASHILSEIGFNIKDMRSEQRNLTWDSKFYSVKHKGVANKNARWNLCYSEKGSEADLPNGKGTVIPFSEIPVTDYIRIRLSEIIGEKAKNMVAEGNLYYDIKKTGIGYHGDAERNIVIAVRLGEDFSLCYQWYLKSSPIGKNLSLTLKEGDLYIMSEKAVGKDWLKRNIPTLRHSAGCDHYTKVQ